MISQQFILLGGVIFAAYRVDHQVASGINPFTATCLYGGVVFLVALIWAVYYIKTIRARYWHNWLLAVGALFGWVNWGILTWSYYNQRACPLNCPNTSPWEAPCLYGALLFTVALIIGIRLWRRER